MEVMWWWMNGQNGWMTMGILVNAARLQGYLVLKDAHALGLYKSMALSGEVPPGHS